MIPVRFYSKEISWRADFVDLCVARIEAAHKEGRRPLICLAGGSTPYPLYEALCQVLVNRHRSDSPPIAAFIGDERWEPDNPDRQNEPMMRSAFKAALDIGAMDLIGWNLETTPEEACTRMRESLTMYLGSLRSFDFACLGLGADGHTAGLFAPMGEPGDAGQYRAPVPPYHRLSLSAGLLSRARSACFALTLPGKEDAATRLIHGDKSITATMARSADSLMHILCR